MSGWILLLVGTVIAVVDIVVGYRFTRTGLDPLAPPDDGAQSPEALRRLGFIIILVAPLIFLVLAALAFGLIPSGGIEPIRGVIG